MLIAICIFRMGMEEHKVLFIIAIISTIEMTIGSQFKAALPTCSTQQFPVVASSCRMQKHFALGNKFNK